MKPKILFLFIAAMTLHVSGQQDMTSDAPETKKGLVKVTILYPNGEGKNFDMDYYSSKHMPMLKTLMGDSLKYYEIDKGISGRTPEEPLPYLAIGYLFFENLSDYQESFGANADKILNDIPNYTNIQPMVQISEVVQ